MPTFLTMVWPSDSVHTGSSTHGLMQLTNTVMAREKSLLGLLLLLTAWIQGFRNSGQFVCIKDWNRCQDEQAFKSVVRIRTRLTSITTIILSRRDFFFRGGGFLISLSSFFLQFFSFFVIFVILTLSRLFTLLETLVKYQIWKAKTDPNHSILKRENKKRSQM